MQTKIIERYFFFILLFITFVFSFLIFRPFWMVLVLGGSFSVVLYPIYEWLTNKKVPNWLSALLTVLFFVIIIGIPLFGIGAIVFNQSQNAYEMIVSNQNSISFIDSINTSINKILPEGISFDLYGKISDLISLVTNNIASIFSTTVSTILSLVLTLLSIFYFLKDGARFRKALIILSPLSDVDDQKIIARLAVSINGIIKGYLFVALIQGILMGIGLTLFGVPNAALWAVITVITALIPTIGTALISVPAIIFLLVTGNTVQAIGMLCWAVAVVGMIDNLLSPLIVGSKTKLPPFLILFSVLGGISLVGPLGILVGPLTISLLYTLISLYRDEFQNNN
ncbi:MAG: AI-2E family transporter [Burkholderiales bacterium]|nr:AI-2E family transporter [Burkholderiales bacterium]